MGSGSSKPAEAPTSQVWKSDTPVRFSSGLVDSLQSSPETDSTRAKTLELHIQSRVNAELKKLQDQAAKDYEELQTKISSKEPEKETKSAGDTLRDLGRESVQNDVKELRKKLEQRKKLADVDEGIEKAKSEVVKCLRNNDRRPLDCWKEVETFKQEVRRLEGMWVEKVVR
ncbi:putative altered inheritance of mitochondria protein 13, mitochondrial [Tricladium varicosporioides]|nr:putative altered inheritance of mitochondria protein 13, mitochondrial [Hymenoscyphus varicosporioides]